MNPVKYICLKLPTIDQHKPFSCTCKFFTCICQSKIIDTITIPISLDKISHDLSHNNPLVFQLALFKEEEIIS